MNAPLESLNIEEIVKIVLRAAHIVDLLDHTPDRVTLKISLLDLPKLAFLFHGVNLQGRAIRIPGLKGLSVSVLRGTATVDYDSSILPPELWEQFGKIRNDPQYEPVFVDRLKSVLSEWDLKER
ncbi:MAG: hypothetical protein FJ118_02030 [Deltaproteobacteria bacterium]|nr:hypothetical protein [Deltaproteobacteria bacterium]